VSAFDRLDEIQPVLLWDGVLVRPLHGERATLSVVELDPGVLLPQHSHMNEQIGVMLRGSMTFRIGNETEDVLPGSTWRIPADVPHEVTAGPDGAVVVEIFAPVREDWKAREAVAPRRPRFP
jgi:quercetin dioxygenase-like cupin family protein